jgi:acyl-CoA thioester hydrolase
MAKNNYNYRVYYEHTDAGGVVYHSRYLNFFERCRSDWLRDKNIIQSELQNKHDLVYVVRAMDIKYKRPARMDDILSISCEMIKIKNASVDFYQEMYNQNNELLATAVVQAACLQASNFKVIAMPDFLKEKLKETIIES